MQSRPEEPGQQPRRARAQADDECGACAPGQAEGPGGDGGGGAAYRFWLDVAGFGAAELSVSLQGRRLVVRGRRRSEEEAADGCVAQRFRELRRQVPLPDDADLGALACRLHGGRLCVHAPRRRDPPKDSAPATRGRDSGVAGGRACPDPPPLPGPDGSEEG